MSEIVRVGIVGGGPAGLLSAITLSRAGVLAEVFEEHPQVGLPRHCTGLVSAETIDHIRRIAEGLSNDFIIQSFREYVVKVINSDESVTLKIPGKVYVTDRALLEKELMDAALSEGAEVSLKTRVTDLTEDGHLMISGSSGLRRYDLVILAEGSAMSFSTSLRLCRSKNYLRGLQSIVRVRGAAPQNPIIYVGGEVSTSFFGWVVPYGDHRAIIGYADKSISLEGLRRLINTFLEDYGIRGEEEGFFGGLIPMVRPCRPALNRVIGVGDTIASIKPLSGGGLYPIVREVENLPTVINSSTAEEYVRRVEPLLSKLRRQHLLRRALNLLGGYAGLVRVLWSLGIRELTISNYDLLKLRI